MDVEFIKNKANECEIEVKGENHTLANVIREELYPVSGVEGAAYTIEHPLLSSPRIWVKTKSGRRASKALVEAAKSAASQAQAFKTAFKKACK